MPTLRRVSKINYSDTVRKKKSKKKTTRKIRQEEKKKLLIIDFSHIPVIRKAETETVLPTYWSVVHENERISMDSINKLQHDLERLLTTSIHRRYFLETGQQPVKKSHHSSSEEQTRINQKTLSESLILLEPPKPKNKKQIKKNGLIINCDLPKDPKIILPSYEKTDKFWDFIDPYCAPLAGNGLEFLESFIQEFSKPVDLNIPESKGHYLNSLSDCSLDDDQASTHGKRGRDLKKEEPENLVELFGGSSVSNIIKNLVKKNRTSQLKKGNAATAEKRSKRKIKIHRLGVCCEKRFIKELAKENILEAKLDEENDEVLQEIKKCQSELTKVNKFNIEELLKLHASAVKEVQYTSVKDKLKITDNELYNLYKKITSSGDKIDKTLMTKMLKELGPNAEALLSQQHAELATIYSM